MTLETRTVQFAREFSKTKAVSSDLQNLVLAIARKISGRVNAPGSNLKCEETVSELHVETSRTDGAYPSEFKPLKANSNTTQENRPKILGSLDRIINGNGMTEEELLLAIEQALESIDASDKTGIKSTAEDLTANTGLNWATRSISMTGSETSSTPRVRCKRDLSIYMTEKCKEHRTENRIHHEEALRQALRHQENMAKELFPMED